ncbi:MAG: hypothetical protein Q7S68_04205 [Deltaproteobacteria bacterium]|nr:hypothetical protein [Deltaproteobacteria bacterium]
MKENKKIIGKIVNFFNSTSLLGILIIVVAILQYKSGNYSAGKYGPIHPGDKGEIFLSFLELVVGVSIFVIGVYYRKK